LRFEWDEKKHEENIEKHRVSFDIAKTVFDDKFAKYIYDDKHSANEEWFIQRSRVNTPTLASVLSPAGEGCRACPADWIPVIVIGVAEIINQELYVCYCMRGENEEITRLISARRATKQEIKFYMEGKL
jgi:hypothetical protein